MEISEKVAYLKGLAEGLNLDTESKEGKLIAAIIDVLDDMAEKFAEIDDELCDVEDGLDAVSDDLSDVEETLYFALDDDEDEDEDDEEEECFMTNCPECEEEVYFDESVLEDGEVICPNCGAKLEFDLSDLVNDDENEDEEEFPIRKKRTAGRRFFFCLLRGGDGADVAGSRIIGQRAGAVDAVRAGVGIGQLQVAAVQPAGRGQGHAGKVGILRYAGKGRQQRRGGVLRVFIAAELH